jgi:quercetin dioxygenase-like cupin family protein
MDIWHLSDEPLDPHHPRILRTDPGANRVIALLLPAGELLQDHEVRERALVFLVEGEAVVRANGDATELTAPALLHFDPSERHEVEARTDARLTLCLAPWSEGYHDRHPQDQGAT